MRQSPSASPSISPISCLVRAITMPPKAIPPGFFFAKKSQIGRLAGMFFTPRHSVVSTTCSPADTANRLYIPDGGCSPAPAWIGIYRAGPGCLVAGVWWDYALNDSLVPRFRLSNDAQKIGVVAG